MAGSRWAVDTREGKRRIGDTIIPLWVCGNYDAIGQFASLVFNNADEDDKIYLAVIEIYYDGSAVTNREFTTFEYDDTQDRPAGEMAFQGKLGDDELLVMADSKLVDLFLATPSDDWSKISLKNRDGKSSVVVL